jgi:hypothetical protein
MISFSKSLKLFKMKAATKFFTGVLLTMVAIFVFESIYNWKESKASFMKAYHEGRDSGSTMVKK